MDNELSKININWDSGIYANTINILYCEVLNLVYLTKKDKKRTKNSNNN